MFDYAKCIEKEFSNKNFTLNKVYIIKNRSIETDNGFISIKSVPEFNKDKYFSEFQFELCKFKLVGENEYKKR